MICWVVTPCNSVEAHRHFTATYRRHLEGGGLTGNTAAATNLSIVEFEVLTAVVMKSTIFWDITQCSPLRVKRRFGGTYRLQLQGRKISRARNQRESRWRAEQSVMQFFWRNRGNLRRTSVKTASLQTEIWAQGLPHMKRTAAHSIDTTP
jgi:hypothetical protein